MLTKRHPLRPSTLPGKFLLNVLGHGLPSNFIRICNNGLPSSKQQLNSKQKSFNILRHGLGGSMSRFTLLQGFQLGDRGLLVPWTTLDARRGGWFKYDISLEILESWNPGISIFPKTSPGHLEILKSRDSRRFF